MSLSLFQRLKRDLFMHNLTLVCNLQAFPCDQFLGQEPLKNDELAGHFTAKGLSFPVFGKVSVNGDETDPLFDWLKSALPGYLTNTVKWNFTKFLVVNGLPVKRYGPNDNPLSFEGDIVEALKSVKKGGEL